MPMLRLREVGRACGSGGASAGARRDGQGCRRPRPQVRSHGCPIRSFDFSRGADELELSWSQPVLLSLIDGCLHFADLANDVQQYCACLYSTTL
eukprot:scaffold161700_cov37-Prasinocladus_malaysianus.AAC.1